METIRKTDSRRGRIAYEVAGLAWLAEASDPGAAVVPVLDHGATWLEEPRVVSVSPSAQDAEAFGRARAHTLAAGATHLGAAPDGYAGDGWMGEAHLSLPDRPRPAPRWAVARDEAARASSSIVFVRWARIRRARTATRARKIRARATAIGSV